MLGIYLITCRLILCGFSNRYFLVMLVSTLIAMGYPMIVSADICVGAVPYRYTENLRQDHREYVELAGKSFDLRTNAFDNLYGKVFFEEPQS